VGGGVNSIGSTVLATRLFGSQGGRALSIVNMSFGLGAFIGPLIAGAVLDATHQYQPIFVGIATLVVIPLLIFARVPLPHPKASEQGRERLPRPDRQAVLLLALVGFLYLGAEIGFGGWIVTYLRQTGDVGVAAASRIAAAYWLALSVSSLGAAVRPR